MIRRRLTPNRYPPSEVLRRQLCERLGVAETVPDDALLDLIEETAPDVHAQNEAEAGLPHSED